MSIAQGRTAVARVAGGELAPKVQDKAEYLDGVSSQVDTLLAIVYVFLALAILDRVHGHRQHAVALAPGADA